MFKNNKWDQQYKKSSIESKGLHSYFYHKFFEGYSEYYVRDDEGKNRLRREYTSIGYLPDISGKRFLAHKFLYWGLFIIAGFIFVYSALILGGSKSDSDWYAVISQSLALFSMLILLWSLICFTMCSGVLTIHDFKSGPLAVRNNSLIVAVLMAISFLIKGIGLIILLIQNDTGSISSYTVPSVIGMLISTILIFFICLIENHVKYYEHGQKRELSGSMEIN